MKKCIFANIAVLTVLFFCGCQTNYQTLPDMPEYPDLQKNYDTSAVIEYYPYGNKISDGILLEKLAEYNYSNIINGTHYRNIIPLQVKVLDFVDIKHNIYNCEDGRYIDTRVIVMIRRNGEIVNGKLQYPAPRYFQAYSQKHIDEDKEILTEDYVENIKSAFDNLFKIAEFRSCLEPSKVNPYSVQNVELSANELWMRSKYFQSSSNQNIYEAMRYAYLAAKAGHKEALNYFISNSNSKNSFLGQGNNSFHSYMNKNTEK